jgi:hypothetical protein
MAPPVHVTCGEPARPSMPEDGLDDDYLLFPYCCDLCGVLFYVAPDEEAPTNGNPNRGLL